MIAYVEEVEERMKWEVVKLEDKEVYTLAYANDMVLMAEKGKEMRSMIEIFREYFQEKKVRFEYG